VKLLAYDLPSPWKIEAGGMDLAMSRFAGVREATWDDVDPAEADYIIAPFTFKVRVPVDQGFRQLNGSDVMLPGAFRGVARDPADECKLRAALLRAFLANLPLYERYPEKHVFIDNGDLDRPCEILEESILFKTNATYRDRRVLPMIYFVRNPLPVSPITDADLDVSFLGHVDQHPIRDALKSWSESQSDLVVEFTGTRTSFHQVPAERRPDMARQAFELMLRSKFVLCPRGVGPTSRRLFEVLAHGRIPIHISDAARLPLESVIDYTRFMVRVPEGFVGRTGEYIDEFLSQHDLASASCLARQAYVEYFAAESFRHFVELSLLTRPA
jgi:hypothetical protein